MEFRPLFRLISKLSPKLTQLLIHILVIVRCPYVVGVRVLVRNQAGSVLLVRHSYIPGWYFPGGGVDKGEIMAQAACRELREETGIECVGIPVLKGIYLNKSGLGRDHIGFFEAAEWRPATNYLKTSKEISEARFFPMDQLPKELTASTARRLAELRAGNLGNPEEGYW